MLTFTPEARQYVKTKNQPVFLELHHQISCCMDFREAPTISFGEPRTIDHYTKNTIEGLIVYIPHELPDIPLTIVLTSFFGFKKLAIEGWILA